jgi:hypothetical protein
MSERKGDGEINKKRENNASMKNMNIKWKSIA